MGAILHAAAFAILGFLLWPLVEYAIHGVLAHRFHTPVSPMHGSHHRDPAAVFTSPIGWVPVAAALYAAYALVVGASAGAWMILGTIAGFARYEVIHFRIHFRTPRNERERRLRAHHLAHHFCDARSYHGVTTRTWDRFFGTLPAHAEADYARAAMRPPLAGRSNLRQMYDPRGVFGLRRRAR